MNSVTLIGAGPAGLTCALALTQRGATVQILEQESMVGGLSRTLPHNGHLLDIGGHRFFTRSANVMQIWQDLLPNDFIATARTSNIFFQNRLLTYPLESLNILQQLGPGETFRFLLSYLHNLFQPVIAIDSFEGWMIRHFGRRLYRAFFQEYTEKIWGIPCREISSDWAQQRIHGLSVAGILKSAFPFLPSAQTEPKTVIQKFHYPVRGPGMMWEACANRVRETGAEIRTGVTIDQLTHHNRAVHEISGQDSSGRSHTFPVENVISSMPLQQLIFALQPAPPDSILQAARRLSYRDYLMVLLVVGKKDIFADQWRYIQDHGFRVARIQNFKNWSPAMVNHLDETTLGMEYYLNYVDEEWQWSDQQWRDLAVNECVKLSLIEAGQVQDSCVVRIRRAYPTYDLHYRETVNLLREYLERFTNLQTIGRNGLHRYNNMDHSMLSGLAAADRLFGAGSSSWDVTA